MPNKPRPENRARPVRFEDDVWARVLEVAARLTITPSAFVRDAVREKLDRK